MVSVYPLLLFGGGHIAVDLSRGNFILSVDDGWIRFMADSHQVSFIRAIHHKKLCSYTLRIIHECSCNMKLVNKLKKRDKL